MGHQCKQTIIVLEDTKYYIDVNKCDIHIVNKSIRKIREIVEKLEKNKNDMNIIYHIHHPKIGMFFLFSNFGDEYKK